MAVQEYQGEKVQDVVERDLVRALFQPIVTIESGAVVGYEALARGPQGSALEFPDALFRAAAEAGVTGLLDRACRQRALSDAVAAGLRTVDLVFLNVEPSALETGAVVDPLSELDLHRLGVVVELTERALAARPSEVLAAVRWLRERGCRIALDDVGVDHRSLALMPFLAPDVIKLDRAIVQGRAPARAAARVLNAVGAESERSGAVVLAEGIETEEHLQRARAMGATLGQGWLFGRPQPLAAAADSDPIADDGDPAGPPARPPFIPMRPPGMDIRVTPFELIADSRRIRHGDKRLLLTLSQQLEEEALGLSAEAVVIATFQDEKFFTPITRRRYERLADRAALVGALGVGMPSAPGAGVRGAALSTDDPLRGEWDVIVVSPHFAGAFVARDLGDEGVDLERRFEFFVTYDRALVVEAAQPLLRLLIRTQ